VRRVLHAGDATGREIGRALWERTITLPSVETIKHALVTDLVVDDGAVCGLRYFDSLGTRHEVRGRAVLLATGGAGQIFRETTNPAVATGDGIALAYEAGARVADLEFVQFHPTALNRAGAPRFLLSEALRGEGARLVNVRGEPFMERYHPDGDLAPRDVVARSIVREAQATGGVVSLTLAHLDPAAVRRRFPTIAAMCRHLGLDLARDPIPVGPAAHYLMGGIRTDEWGRTSQRGLFAAGETACTGVHGANRLASNSLLEGLVFGARAAAAMRDGLPEARSAGAAAGRAARDGRTTDVDDWRLMSRARAQGSDSHSRGDSQEVADIEQVRDLMWRAVGLFRTRETLAEAASALEGAYVSGREVLGRQNRSDAARWRHVNLVTVARLVALAALCREESRGGHFRQDFPSRDDRNWRYHAMDAKAAGEARPVPSTK
jgi:L-aspartate oxidase